MLPSGSTLTTSVNNLANQLIGIALAEEHFSGVDDFESGIMRAAARVGYKVTVDVCTIPQHIQFLKTSPALTREGFWEAALNPGVALRTLGQCKGDLPGSGELQPRGDALTHAILQGMYPYTHTPFFDTLKTRFPKPVLSERHQRQIDRIVTDATRYKLAQIPLTQTDNETDCSFFHHHEFFARYDLEQFELDELIDIANHAQFQSAHGCSAVNKILKKDYGVSSLHYL